MVTAAVQENGDNSGPLLVHCRCVYEQKSCDSGSLLHVYYIITNSGNTRPCVQIAHESLCMYNCGPQISSAWNDLNHLIFFNHELNS